MRASALVAWLARAVRVGLAGAVMGCGSMTLDDAYATQDRVLRQRQAAGARLVGYKVAFTSPAIQEVWSVSAPAHGPLFDDMRVADGGRVPAASFETLLAEVEIAFTLEAPLLPPVWDVEQARRAVGSVHLALELGDDRLGESPDALQLIAGGIGAHRFAVGAAHDPGRVDLTDLRCALSVDNEVVNTGPPSDAMGDPYKVLAWLAGALSAQGRSLEPGQIVLTGALGRSYFPTGGPAGTYTGSCGPLGEVSVTVE